MNKTAARNTAAKKTAARKPVAKKALAPGVGTRGRVNTEAPRGYTYQAHLDHALEETFPASDPISISPPARRAAAQRSAQDPIDWPLQRGGPSAEGDAGHADDGPVDDG